MAKSNITIVLFLSTLISIASVLSFANNFEDKKTLLFFTATWCGSCKVAANDMNSNEKLQDVLKNYDVVTLDYDVDTDVVRGYNIKLVPSFVIMHKGKEVGRKVGYSGKPNELYNFLK